MRASMISSTGFRHLLLDLIADAGGNDLAGAAQAPVIGNAVAGGIHIGSNIVGVQTHDIAQGAIALQGQVFLVVIHIKNSLGGIDNAPGDSNADFHGISQAVIDLLAIIAEGHDLERELFAGGVYFNGGGVIAGGGLYTQLF